jgi:hypothetical protein
MASTSLQVRDDFKVISCSDVALAQQIDPILEEVYCVKAKLNAAANYSVEKILERSRQSSASWQTSHSAKQQKRPL